MLVKLFAIDSYYCNVRQLQSDREGIKLGSPEYIHETMNSMAKTARLGVTNIFAQHQQTSISKIAKAAIMITRVS